MEHPGREARFCQTESSCGKLERVAHRTHQGGAEILHMNVSLTDDLRDFVRKKVENGQFPSEEAVLQEALRRFRQADRDEGVAGEQLTLEDLIDYDAIESCTREVEGKDVPSIEEVRAALSKIRGSMAQVVIEER